MKKRALLFIAIGLVLVLAVTGTTIAMLSTKTDTKNNSFAPGVLTAPIFENGNKAGDGSNTITTSGKNAAKLVQVQNPANEHEVDAYIRVMLVPTFRTSGGSLAGNMDLASSGNKVTISAPNGGTVTLNLISGWDTNWIYSNGYYYCKTIVHPGSLTPAILESVTVSDTALWSTFNLEVLSDAIQAEGGAAAGAWGSGIASQLQH